MKVPRFFKTRDDMTGWEKFYSMTGEYEAIMISLQNSSTSHIAQLFLPEDLEIKKILPCSEKEFFLVMDKVYSHYKKALRRAEIKEQIKKLEEELQGL